MHIKSAFPFFIAKPGNYIHRVRSGRSYYYRGEYSHTIFELWCGGTGCCSDKTSRRGKLLEFADAPICATCEGRAIGAGQTDSQTINGRPVIFQPRKGKWSVLQPIPEMPIQTS